MSLTYNNGTLLAICPALLEVITFGEDEAEAIKRTPLRTASALRAPASARFGRAEGAAD